MALAAPIRQTTDRFFGFPSYSILDTDFITNQYDAHSYRTPIIFTPFAAIEGVIKALVFPLYALVGTIAFPIMAAVEGVRCKRMKDSPDEKAELKKKAFRHLGAGLVSAGTTVALAGFVLLCVYYAPLSIPIVAVIGGVGASVAIHVYRVWNRPREIIEPRLEKDSGEESDTEVQPS